MNELHASNLRDYARVLWRRRLTLIVVTVLVPAVAVAMAVRQSPVYQADAQVLLSGDNLAATLTGVDSTSLFTDPVRVAETQAELASVPAVAQGVAKANPDLHLSAGEILADVSVVAASDADILDFSAQNGDPRIAARLAAAYATQYTRYRRTIDTAAIARALTEAEQHLDQMRSQGQTGTPLYSSLADKVQTLRTMEALQTSNASVVQSPSGAAKVSPKPFRNAVLGLALGLILGIGLAFLREALDTRIRTADEIARSLHLSLLGRLSEPPRKVASHNGLVTLAEPAGPASESFRVLRTNLDFANMERRAHSILITSALQAEGKSTTAANLAATLARAGRSVILVDCDLRRPSLHTFFDLDPQLGVTTVALGHARLEEALCPIVLDREGHPSPIVPAQSNGNGLHGQPGGLLHVLPAGPIPPDPGEFVETGAVARLLEELQSRAQVVIVDTPPLLSVGDALSLSSRLDAILLVTRLSRLRRPMLRELNRALEMTTCAKLGFVVTGAEAEEGFGGGAYGYGYYSNYSPAPAAQAASPQQSA